jgi:hypothetical protein
MRSEITKLIEKVHPFEIPSAYLEFLEWFGGLAIHANGTRFATFGVGPQTYDWYDHIGDEHWFREPGEFGFLSLAWLLYRINPHDRFLLVDFFLDLAGNVSKYCVIAVGPWHDVAYRKSFEVVKDLKAKPGSWKVVANTFLEFLQITWETEGSFGFI